MSSVQHLQHKREELQQQYELLSEKIKRLRNNSAIEAGTSVAFQLDKEIEHFEAQRDRLRKEIHSLESERVHNALLQLNYFQQAQLFREFIEQNRIGAFLVHGSPQYLMVT
jgi:predicted nuclease with TOPRIM domain